MNTQDADRLPFPMGEMMDTVSLSSISRFAAYAVALSKVWRGCVAHPLRVSAVSHNIPIYTAESGKILPGNQWILMNMESHPRILCLANGISLKLNVEGIVHSYAYESPNNGASIILALLRKVMEPHGNDK